MLLHNSCHLQGQFNNQRVVAASALFVWQAKWGGRDVFVTGDFVAWTVSPLCQLPEKPATAGYFFWCDLYFEEMASQMFSLYALSAGV